MIAQGIEMEMGIKYWLQIGLNFDLLNNGLMFCLWDG